MSEEIATNRKALRDYHILERYEAGVELRGTEVKSIRQGRLNLTDAFARVERGQVWLYNMDIQPYDKASFEQHEPRRTRRLLLHKREIAKLFAHTQQKGLTIVPLSLYIRKGMAKVELGVARGKKAHDKRRTIAERDMRRDLQREAKSAGRIKL